MALIDSLLRGSNLANNFNRGAILSANASTAYPTAQQNLYTLMTNNRYLDEKNRLVNQGLGFGNQSVNLANQAQTINNQYLPEKDQLTNQGLGLSNTSQSLLNAAQATNNRYIVPFNEQKLTYGDLLNQGQGLSNAGKSLENETRTITNKYLDADQQQRLQQLINGNYGSALRNQALSIENSYLGDFQKAKLQAAFLSNVHATLANKSAETENYYQPYFNDQKLYAAGLANIGSQLENDTRSINNKSLPDLNAARLKGLTLQNDATGINNRYLDPLNQERVRGARLGNDTIDINNQTLPAINAERLAGLDLSNQNQATTNLYQPATIESTLRGNEALANSRNIGGGGGGKGGVGAQAEAAFQSYVGKDNPQLGGDPDKIYEAANVLRQGGDTLSDGTKLNGLSPAALAALDRQEKSSNTAAGTNQQRFAATLDSIFKQADPQVQSASKYAGLLGAAKLKAAQAAAQTGKVDPDYSNYINFVRTTIPSLASEMLRTGGANSTDSQKLSAMAAADPLTLASNPKLAIKQWESLKSIYQSIGKTLAQGPGQTRIGLRKAAGGGATAPKAGGTNWVMKNGQLVEAK